MRFLPPEWSTQYGVMVTWPHDDTDWQSDLPSVEHTYLALSQAITRFEHLIVICHNDDVKSRVAWLFAQNDVDPNRVSLSIAPCNDTWARDHGPITVVEDGVHKLLDFKFNAWGAKYEANLDDQITRTTFNAGVFPHDAIESIDWVLEGGSIESNGKGKILTTSQCVLAATRNGERDKSEVAQKFGEWFGAQTTLWLDFGSLAGDDTDAHIDTLARFIDEQTIAYVSCPDRNDMHYEALLAMERQLREIADNHGLRLIALPWPNAIFNKDQKRLPATYANFLIINGAVLVPTYDVPQDEQALALFSELFKDREVVGIPCRPLIKQFGSLHCVTMQIPRVETIA